MLIECAFEIKKTRRLPEFKKSIEMKLVFRAVRQSQLAARNKKWRVTTKCRGLNFNESLFAVGLKRKNVVAQPISFRLGNVINLVREARQPKLRQSPMFELNNELLSCQAQ